MQDLGARDGMRRRERERLLADGGSCSSDGAVAQNQNHLSLYFCQSDYLVLHCNLLFVSLLFFQQVTRAFLMTPASICNATRQLTPQLDDMQSSGSRTDESESKEVKGDSSKSTHHKS